MAHKKKRGQKRENDYYYRTAKEEGFRSRSVYKLLEANTKKPLLQKGFKIVDLGAHPGGWLQVANKYVGRHGLLIGVDIKPILPLNSENIKLIMMDIHDPQLPDIILRIARGKLNTVLSDLSPNISGIWEIDSAVQLDLAENAFQITSQILKKGGYFFIKLFQSPEIKPYFEKIKKMFENTAYFKPKASKPSSSEIYIIAEGFRPLS